jgi:hypothetical protein
MAREADGCQLSFLILQFYGTCSFNYYTFAQDVSVFAQKHQATLKKASSTLRIFKLRSKHCNFRSNTIMLAIFQREKWLQFMKKKKTDPTEVIQPSIESVSSFFCLILFRINGHQRHQDLERCIRDRLISRLKQPRKYQRLGARPGLLLHLLEQLLST